MAKNISGLRRGGPGRPRGVSNKATQAEKEFARGVLEDPVYRANLIARAQRGKLSPPVEIMLWDRAYGKVKDTLKMEGDLDLSSAGQRIASLLAEVAAAPRGRKRRPSTPHHQPRRRSAFD